jgi:putative ABC transport system permease protein
MLVSVKAVDPAVYPFYGEVKLDPPAPLRAVLDSRSAAVSDDLLFRLKTRVGGNLRLGGQDFRIAGAAGIRARPLDRQHQRRAARDDQPRGPRPHRPHQPRQPRRERFLFLLPPGGPDVQQVRNVLKQAFPEGLIADYRETHPIVTRGLERSTTFLSLISLIALIVGALGVATAMHAHLQQKMDTIAC